MVGYLTAALDGWNRYVINEQEWRGAPHPSGWAPGSPGMPLLQLQPPRGGSSLSLSLWNSQSSWQNLTTYHQASLLVWFCAYSAGVIALLASLAEPLIAERIRTSYDTDKVGHRSAGKPS